MSTIEGQEKLRADLASLRLDRGPASAPRRRPRRGRLIVILGSVLVAVGAGAWFTMGRIPTVTVTQAIRTNAQQIGPAPVLSGSGYVVTGDRYISLGVRVPGRIEEYFVEEGQGVHKGDPLVRIDNRDYRATVDRIEASLAVAKANLALAEAELRRGAVLSQKALISQQELEVQQNKAEVARAQVQQIVAELNSATVNLEYTVLHAPTDGVILAKLKEVGEIAVPGGFAGSGDLIRMANLDDLRAEVDINEAELNRIHIGQAAEVTPDAYPDARYPARVVKLYPQVDRQKGTLKVEVQITQPDNRLLPDMSARITFLADAPKANDATPVVLIPATALRRDSQGRQFVWVVHNGSVSQTVIETAGNVGERVRVASGLTGTETVVTSDDARVRDQGRVQVGNESR